MDMLCFGLYEYGSYAVGGAGMPMKATKFLWLILSILIFVAWMADRCGKL